MRTHERLTACACLAALALLSAHSAACAQELRRRGIVGVAVGAVSDEARAAAKLQAGQGVLVLNVLAGGAGEAAGVRAGDVVLAVNGAAVAGVPEFVAAAKALRAGERLELAVARGAERLTLSTSMKEIVESDPAFEVLYRAVAVKGALRRVVVTKPKGAGRFPAVLMIGGIGCYSIDDPLNPDHPYKKILYNLTRNVGSSRVDLQACKLEYSIVSPK